LVKHLKISVLEAAALAALLVCAQIMTGCNRAAETGRKIEPVYDKNTGRLTLLKYDSKGSGKIDTWSYMDGARVVRIEIDQDGDGKIDRWEYYGADGKLEKVGFSRLNDGKVDAWSHPGPDGSIARIEVSTRRDGHVDRIEYYEKGVLVRAEEDGDGDGKIDKWETYEGSRIASVAFDTIHRGTPDRRLIYALDGSVRLEVDLKGDGHFVESQIPNPTPRQARGALSASKGKSSR